MTFRSRTRVTWIILLAICISAAVAVLLRAPRLPMPVSPSVALSTQSASPSAPVIKQSADSNAAASFSKANDLETYEESVAGDRSLGPLTKAKIISECLMFKIRPNFAAEILSERISPRIKDPGVVERHAKSLAGRCARVDSAQLTRRDMLDAYAESAKEGNPEAKAFLLKYDALISRLGENAEGSAADIATLAKSLAQTRDPGAVFELAGLFGEGSLIHGPASGSAEAAAAWMLVACDLGYDCGPDSAIVRGSCLFGGLYCDAGGLEENMRLWQFSPDSFEFVRELRRKIYQGIKTGDVDALFNEH